MNGASPLSPDTNPEDSSAELAYFTELPARVHEQIEGLLRGRRPVVRAALRNLVPYLSGWLIARHVAQLRESGRAETPFFTEAARLRAPETLAQSALEDASGEGTPSRLPYSGLGPSMQTLIREGSRGAARRILDGLGRGAPLPPGTLLCLALQPNSTRAFLPVARRLPKERVCFLLEPEDQVSISLVEDSGLSFRLLPPVATRHDALEIAARGVELARLSLKLPQIGWWGAAERDPNGHSPAGSSLVPAEIRRLRSSTLWQLLRGVSFAARLTAALEHYAPSHVLYITHRALIDEILRSRPPPGRVVFFLQGIVPPIPPVFTPLRVDLALCGSELDRPYLDRCGIPEERISSTGYPDYDEVIHLDGQRCRTQLCATHPRANGRPIVVFTSQYKTSAFPEWARRKNLEVLVVTARKRGDIFFVIKPHPRRESMSARFLAQLPENVVVDRTSSTLALLKGADVVVTYWSTTALEAVLVATPLVQLNATGLPDYFPLVEQLARRPARDPSDLVAQLDVELSVEGRARFEQQRRAFLARQRIELDGLAALRAARKIEETITD